jgi:hypothetical protein
MGCKYTSLKTEGINYTGTRPEWGANICPLKTEAVNYSGNKT